MILCVRECVCERECERESVKERVCVRECVCMVHGRLCNIISLSGGCTVEPLSL